MKLLRRAYFALLYALPAVLFFSYYPVISLGGDASMNFELSLPLIWLVFFDIIAFVSLIIFRGKSLVFLRTSAGYDRGRDARHPQRRDDATSFLKSTSDFPLETISDRRFFLFTLFPFYATLSILWSFNSTRAFLTAGIIWLLFFAVFAIIYVTPLLNPPKNFRRTLLKTFFISSAIVCVICWLQAILDVLGVGREVTLLCQGCVSQTFGFPHPSGFAIEPQFMGNLLLAPTLLSLYLLVVVDNKSSKRPSATNGERNERRATRNESRRSPSEERASSFFRGNARESEHSEDGLAQACRVKNYYLLLAGAFIFSATLFLTFSRGAIYAFAVALVILIIFALARHQFRPALIVIPVAAFVFTIVMQGVFNVIGPTHDSFCSGVAKSLNQLSLGIIDLRSTCPATPVQATQPTFDGYVAESTDIRLNLNAAALKTWYAAPGADLGTSRIGHNCPQDNSFFNDTCESYTIEKYNRHSILFGVGLGGAGAALYKNRAVTNVTTPKEIVQNQPISLLLELGLIGVILIIFSLLLAFCPQIFPAELIDGRSATTAKPVATFWQHPALPLLLSLIIAYAITLQFFSGLPNALHIYLIPPLLFYALQNSEKTIALSK